MLLVKKKPRIYLTAGGTGGHIYPALAMAQELEQDYDVYFIASKKKLDEKLLSKKKTYFFPLTGYQTKKDLFLSLIFYFYSFLYCFFLFLFKRPKAILGIGSYTSIGPILSGFILRIPLYLLEQNAIMGRSNKLLKPFVKKIFTQFESLKETLTGNPIRKEFFTTNFHVNTQDKNRIFVLGGSLGSEFLNEITLGLRATGRFIIEHQSGKHHKDFSEDSYHRYSYIEDIIPFCQRADLIIARAGASTLAELFCIQKPCILIPWSKSMNNHQEINAKSFQQQAHFPVEILQESWGKDICLQEILEKYPLMIDLKYDIKVQKSATMKIKEEMNL